MELLREMLMLLKVKYLESDNLEEKLNIVELGVLLCGGFCGGLRGEEIMKITLNETLENVDAGLGHKTPHIPMALKGKFKGEIGVKCHLIPICALTQYEVNDAL